MAHRKLFFMTASGASFLLAACNGLIASGGSTRPIDPDLWDPARDGLFPPSYATDVEALPPLEDVVTSDPTCSALVDKRRRARIRAVAYRLAQSERAMRQRNDACASHGGEPFDDSYAAGAMDGGSAVSAPAAGNGDARGPSATTGTNNQVAAVDEADFVKNDGHHFFVLARGKFQIVDAWPADQTHRVGALDLSAEGEPRKMFLEGSKAYVYLAVRSASPGYPGYGDSTYSGYAPSYGGSAECTYGYECTPSGDGTDTRIVAIDFSNLAAPRIVRRIDLRGSLLAARKVGSRIHTAIVRASSDEGFVPPVAFPGTCGQASFLDIRRAHEAAYAVAKQAILASDASNDRSSVVVDDGVGQPVACEDIAVQGGGLGSSMLTVASFDGAAARGPIELASLNAEPGFVYASAEHLYVASPERAPYAWGWGSTTRTATFVHRFTLGDGASSHTRVDATGRIPGGVIGQFAMDERGGFLRIASTVGHAPEPEANSVLSVLERQGDRLATVAKIDGIAPSEDIRSVRFDGDRGYVVTFKKTDPLFAFDLANPRAPRMLGELKIPGFSTYMHPIDRNHLLTIGFNASDQGSFAWFTSVRLQIIDVSDMARPRLAFAHDIGTRGTTSEALTNHLAFTYFPEKKLLAVPMEICEGGGQNGQYGDALAFSGLLVFGVDTAAGFTLRGGVDHRSPTPGNPSGFSTPFYGCGTWWTSAHSTVQRSAFFDDFVYSIDPDRMKVQDTRSLGADLATVHF
jgi:hypothetical protein